jgi:antitoxin (DNA-binding transcriptional repressor) of toxin-antitoxin stability system
MIEPVNIHEAKTRFSKLLKRVQMGEEIVIAKAGKQSPVWFPFVKQPRRANQEQRRG